MAGRPGRSGGHNKKPLSQHVLEGTYQPCRHGPKAAGHVLAMPKPAPDWRPSASDVAALSVRGRAWLDAALEAYVFSAVDGLRLLEVCRTVSRVEALEVAGASPELTRESWLLRNGRRWPWSGAVIRRRPRETGLRLEYVDWLLEGHPRQPDDGDPLRRESAYDTFVEFDEPPPDLAGLWHLHRVELLNEWRRRGGQGKPWGARFDGGGQP